MSRKNPKGRVSQAIRWAVENGYTVTEDGVAMGPTGPLKGTIKNKRAKHTGHERVAYWHISIRMDATGTIPVPIHRFVAFLKYGEVSMQAGTVTRHLDSDPHNNHWDNIAIGTQSDNMMDRPEEERIAHAKKAARARRRLEDRDVKRLLRLRAGGAKYTALTTMFGISKSLVSGVVNGTQYPEFDLLRIELGLKKQETANHE